MRLLRLLGELYILRTDYSLASFCPTAYGRDSVLDCCFTPGLVGVLTETLVSTRPAVSPTNAS